MPPPTARPSHVISGMPSVSHSAISWLESPVKVTMPSMSPGVRPASRIAASDASAASWMTGRPESFENSVWPMPLIATRSHMHFGRAMEPGRRDRVEVGPQHWLRLHVILDRVESDELLAVTVIVDAGHDRHAVSHIADRDIAQARHHAHALFEVDEHDDRPVRFVLPRRHAVHRRHPCVDHATTRRLHPVLVKAVTVGAHRAGRLHQRLDNRRSVG